MKSIKKLLATTFATALMAFGVAAPASAQQTGLVNVNIKNVLNNNTVQVAVPVNAAVAVCANVDVNAAVLLAAISDPDVNTFTCRARGNQEVTLTA
jgi:catabolite regulation protein CreA